MSVPCSRCGLLVSEGICAPAPRAFHPMPRHCIAALRAELAAERTRSAMAVQDMVDEICRLRPIERIARLIRDDLKRCAGTVNIVLEAELDDALSPTNDETTAVTVVSSGPTRESARVRAGLRKTTTRV